MKIRFSASRPAKGLAVVYPVFSDGERASGALAPDVWVRVPDEVGERSWVERAGGRSGKGGAVVLVSMGLREGISTKLMLQVGGAVAQAARATGLSQYVLDLSEVVGVKVVAPVQRVCEGLMMGGFRFDGHKSSLDEEVVDPAATVWASTGGKGLKEEVERAVAIGEGVNYARRLAHEPPNMMTPVAMAAEARKLARSAGLKVSVVDEKGMGQLGMGAFLAVGQGSAAPSRLIVLDYEGSSQGVKGGKDGKGGKGRKDRPVVLVGKAITFDTGGYSLKDKQGIVGMKFDKCGGCAVLGVMRAVQRLKVKRRVVALIAAAENMVSSKAYRPNDIITTMAGKTVEIISTDAEGRLVLADTMTYALKRYAPSCMIDVATLTGGISVALGHVRGGLFCDDESLTASLMESGDRTGELLWRLPMDDAYFDMIQGVDSDLRNSAGRAAHAICGAMFLKQFAKSSAPWAHLDIAGMAKTENGPTYCPKGATGFGVRLMCDFLERL